MSKYVDICPYLRCGYSLTPNRTAFHVNRRLKWCVCVFVLSQANDAYLQMAIGNAPWPIGVTMVGIHARTGREKIFSKHVAHVLNDETQRKYIQVRPRDP